MVLSNCTVIENWRKNLQLQLHNSKSLNYNHNYSKIMQLITIFSITIIIFPT